MAVNSTPPDAGFLKLTTDSKTMGLETRQQVYTHRVIVKFWINAKTVGMKIRFSSDGQFYPAVLAWFIRDLRKLLSRMAWRG